MSRMDAARYGFIKFLRPPDAEDDHRALAKVSKITLFQRFLSRDKISSFSQQAKALRRQINGRGRYGHEASAL